MKDDSLSDVQPFMMTNYDVQRQPLKQTEELFDKIAKEVDPWIVGKDDHWFVLDGKRLHKESWNAALVAASKELLKTYPYSAKEQKILKEQIK